MQRGFSLPEMLLVLAVVGGVVAIAVPSLTSTLDRIEVHAAANNITAAHQRARMMAVSRGQVLVLAVDQHQLVIRDRADGTILWSRVGPATAGVMLAGSRQFTFSPQGLTLGLSNATLRLTRGSAIRNVIVSRLGRIRITN